MTHIHRFFLSTKISSGAQSQLDEDDTFHAVKVLRLEEGDPIEVADVEGGVYRVRISSVDDAVRFQAVERIDAAPRYAGISVIQALPQGRKMDMVVEKLSELGVDTLIPVETAKSVKRPRADSEKVKRWRRIARSSAAQSKRNFVMEISSPVPLEGCIAGSAGSLVVLTNEVEAEPLGVVVDGTPPPVSLLVGPEAGFEPHELELLRGYGARFGSLGRQVLRTETAALVAAAILMHHKGELG